jgi:creatinine amidohydrolase
MGVRIKDVPGHQLDRLFAEARFAVLPFGAFEDHGDVGSLGMDSYPAEVLGERLAERLGGFVMPTIDYTCLPLYSRNRRGSISIRHEVAVGLIEDVIRGLFRNGVPGVVVVSGNATNTGIVEAAGEAACDAYRDRFLVLVNCWEVLPDTELRRWFPADAGGGHGGAWELSVVQALVPGAVDLTRGGDQEFRTQLGSGARIYSLGQRGIFDPGWAGYEGAISASTADKGGQILKASEDAMVAMVARLLEAVKR